MQSALFTYALRLAALAPIVCAAPLAFADDEPADETPALPFLRTSEDGGVVTLDLASREFTHAEGEGPAVWLVGVAHVADLSLYEQQQKLLADFDVVLFESVMPGGAMARTDLEPGEMPGATEAKLKFLGSIIERYRQENGDYPDSLDALAETVAEIDSRLISMLPGAKDDAWGRDIAYSTADDGDSFTLLSLGEDGAPGGDDNAADLAITHRDEIAPLATSTEGGLQSELASTLGLAFQLTALSYAEPNFRPSDMTLEELTRAMTDRNLDVSNLEGALDATSLPAQLMKVLLRFVKMANEMLDGAIADVCRLVIIELLGNEKMTQQAMEQFGEGFGDVIIGERNQVVIDDLKHVIDHEPNVESVAIYYGAAHMPDFVTRLREQLSYEPTGEVKWYQAMRVDMNKSAMPREQLEMTRNMLRQTMAQQLKAMKRR